MTPTMIRYHDTGEEIGTVVTIVNPSAPDGQTFSASFHLYERRDNSKYLNHKGPFHLKYDSGEYNNEQQAIWKFDEWVIKQRPLNQYLYGSQEN